MVKRKTKLCISLIIHMLRYYCGGILIGRRVCLITVFHNNRQRHDIEAFGLERREPGVEGGYRHILGVTDGDGGARAAREIFRVL